MDKTKKFIYINLYDNLIDHPIDVKKSILERTTKSFFNVESINLLTSMICEYNKLLPANIMIINDGHTFVDLLKSILHNNSIRVIHPSFEHHSFTQNIENVKVTNTCEFINDSIVIISNPVIPSGNLFHPHKIHELLLKHPKTLFIVDESYIDYMLLEETKGVSVVNLITYENLFIIRSFKTFYPECSLHYIISSSNNIKYYKDLYDKKNVINNNIYVVINILKNIYYYKQHLSTVNEIKQYIIQLFDKFLISYIINKSNVVIVKITDLTKILNIFNDHGIKVFNVYDYETTNYIKLSLDVNLCE